MARLDEFKGMGTIDKANDLLYIVDDSEGITASGSRKITHQDFEQVLDYSSIPRSREIITSISAGGSYLVPLDTLGDIVTINLTSNLSVIAPTTNATGRVVTFIVPPSAFNFIFRINFNYVYNYGGYDRTKTNIVQYFCRESAAGQIEYSISYLQE